MKRAAVSILFLVAVVGVAGAAGTAAQSGPPPPRPIAETDIRENSTKMRSIEFERIKRDAYKKTDRARDPQAEARIELIREDFTRIQKLQDEIVRVYKTGKTIDYAKIAGLAADIRKNSLRLRTNLFEAADDAAQAVEQESGAATASVRDLIIALDGSIGTFVSNPMFLKGKVVDGEDLATARKELDTILSLSGELSAAARRSSALVRRNR